MNLLKQDDYVYFTLQNIFTTTRAQLWFYSSYPPIVLPKFHTEQNLNPKTVSDSPVHI